MRYVDAGGVHLSAVGLGTWQFGSGEWGYGSEYAETTAPEIVRRSLDLGVNLVDTAEIYGMGRSERIVGRALADRRAEAFVATKLFPVLPVDPVVERRARGSARRLPRPADIQPPDQRMGAGGAQHLGMQHARQHDIDGIVGAAADLLHRILARQVSADDLQLGVHGRA